VNIGTVVRDVDGVVFNADVFQHILQAHAGPLGAADRTGRPLITGRGWYEFTAAVAATFELQLVRVVLEFLFELANRESDLLLDRLAAKR